MKNKICVYAICKNEIKFIEQWLNNMSEADYIVVLDTGSTDGTLEKLQADSRVTKVESKIIKPWRFDVARNESMKLIPDDANILVCTDFDELFTPGWGNILREHWLESTTRAHYMYAWSHSELGERTDTFVYDKIHTRDYFWVYPVHEVLARKDPENEVVLDLCNLHDKFYLDHYQDKAKSRTSYFDLLKLSVEENPNDSHVRMLLAREYLINEKLEDALKEYLAVLQMPDVESHDKRLILLESLGRCADIYKALKNYDEAIWYAQEFIKEDYTFREPYMLLGEVYNNMNMFTLAEATVEAGLKYGTKKDTWVERADSWLTLPNEILSYSYYKLGKLDAAIEQIKIVLEHHPDNQWALKNYTVMLEEKLKEVQLKIK